MTPERENLYGCSSQAMSWLGSHVSCRAWPLVGYCLCVPGHLQYNLLRYHTALGLYTYTVKWLGL